MTSWIADPGKQQMEFTTALPTRAGGNALAKPRSACSQEQPIGLKPFPCGRLSLRNVEAKRGHGSLFRVQFPPPNLNKLCVALHIEQPLEIEAADKEVLLQTAPRQPA